MVNKRLYYQIYWDCDCMPGFKPDEMAVLLSILFGHDVKSFELRTKKIRVILKGDVEVKFSAHPTSAYVKPWIQISSPSEEMAKKIYEEIRPVLVEVVARREKEERSEQG